MRRILDDIKTGQLKHVYLLYGEEPYLIRQYRENLREALSDRGDEINVTCFSGHDIDQKQVIDLAETLPFFADHRTIFLDDTGLFNKEGEVLAKYIREIPESTYLIFTETIDDSEAAQKAGRKKTKVEKTSSLFKQVAKEGRAVEFPRQDEYTLTRWVLGRLRREEKQMSRPVLELFLSRTGNDMERIDRELEKLVCYTMGREVIEREDVDLLCGTQVEGKIFEMVNAVAGKQQRRALDLYCDLLIRKEPPMRILYLLTREFQILLQLKGMPGNFSEAAMADQLHLRTFVVSKYRRQAEKFTERQLRDAVRGSVQTEEDIKTGRMNDRLAVEMFLMTYSK